jgi:hydrogenase maturation protease
VYVTGRVLVIGYGNPGRGDDGLGPALAALVEAMGLPGVTVETDYQLTVDHAGMMAGFDVVIFADAMMGIEGPFRFFLVPSVAPGDLGSHQVSPEAALALARLLFGVEPQGWVLGIAGEAFGEVSEGLSVRAEENLREAVEFLRGVITDRSGVDLGHRHAALS